MIARPNCAPPVIHAIVALLNMLLSVASPSATAATFVVKPSVLCRRATAQSAGTDETLRPASSQNPGRL